jgi:hypothetical protein
MKGHWVFRLLKGFLRVGLAIAFPDTKPERPRHTALHAEQLYEDGLISDMEYARCVYGDKE